MLHTGKFFLLLTVALCLHSIGLAYYVDNSTNSNCSNDPAFGSESNPWCTISYALNQMKGGDDLFVKSGTYEETLSISNLVGTAENRTTIQVAPGHSVTIKGAGVDHGRVKITGSDYLTFDGFTVTNMNQGIFVENDSDYVTIQNCTVHFVGQEGIHVKENSDHVIIQNCTIYDTRQWQFNGEGIYIGTGSAGPKDNSSYATIRNNTIYNTIDEGIELKPGTHDCIVEGNVLYNINSGGSTIGSIEVNESTLGVQNWASNPNHIIRNNIIHDSSTGIRAGSGSSVYNNVIYDITAGHYGIYIDNKTSDSYTRRIYHNTVDLANSNAIIVVAGQVDISNNIGPSTTNNIATNSSFFVSTTEGSEDYHLVSGSAPIDAGIDLTGTVPSDLDGNSRLSGSGPDYGAYEYTLGDNTSPAAPTNLRVQF